MTTKEKIRAALLHIRYVNKTKDAVTVTEVCRQASIARSTFYSYYDSVDDVLQDIYESTFEKLEKIDQDAQHSRHQIEVSTLDTLRVIYYYREAFIVLMGDYGEKIFHERSCRHIRSHLKAMAASGGKPEDELLLTFISEGILADILLWLEKYPEISPEKMADFLTERVDVNLKKHTTK